jgi:hypothetical protein
MKYAALYLLVLVGAMAGGYILRDATTPEAAPTSTSAKPVRPATTHAPESWIEDALKKQSADTIDDLVTNHTSTRLPRMTLWLIDASTDEILELWRTLDERDELDMRTYDLILIHWTEIDPRGAIAAAKASNHENPAWWAWGRAEPERALKTALRESPSHADNVLRAIGQFRIDQALILMEKYPEALAHTSIEGIGSGLKREDPEKAVAFMRSHGQSGYKELKTWAERDPDNALAWARSNLRDSTSSALENLVSELVVEHPDRVENWLQGLPTGGLRGALATEYVKHLADQDINQAISFARNEEGPTTRSQLMAALGERLVHKDPEQSIALLRETIEHRQSNPSPGADHNDPVVEAVSAWREYLTMAHPEGMANMVVNLSDDPHHRYALAVMSDWMQQDEVAYAEWLIAQPAGEIRDQGAVSLANHLTVGSRSVGGFQPDHESALGWVAAIQDETKRQASMTNVIYRWMQLDPESARAHLARLPPEDPVRKSFEQHQAP